MALDLSNHGILDFLSCPKTVQEELSLTALKLTRQSCQSLVGKFLPHFSHLTESSVITPKKSGLPNQVVRAESVWTVCTPLASI
jgi:hypothetical protein